MIIVTDVTRRTILRETFLVNFQSREIHVCVRQESYYGVGCYFRIVIQIFMHKMKYTFCKILFALHVTMYVI